MAEKDTPISTPSGNGKLTTSINTVANLNIVSKSMEGLKVICVRRLPQTKDGTFGVMSEDGVPFALTCERKWLNNKKGESCIPTGEYICERTISPKFGETFEVKNVQGRDHILFHKGNIEDDSHGCIIVGEQFETLNSKIAVMSSQQGFNEFMKRLDKLEKFKLVIEYFGVQPLNV